MKQPKRIVDLFLVAILILFGNSCQAQKNATDPVEGVWKGTSLCQVKNSPCHDENVVFHFSRSSKGENGYTVQANKMVNGEEENMGVLEFVYDPAKHTLTCEMAGRNGRPGVWLFKLDGEKIHGTLTLDGNTLYRVIEISKTKV